MEKKGVKSHKSHRIKNSFSFMIKTTKSISTITKLINVKSDYLAEIF